MALEAEGPLLGSRRGLLAGGSWDSRMGRAGGESSPALLLGRGQRTGGKVHPLCETLF